VIVPVRVIFRTMRQERGWGFGVKARTTLFETSSPADLYPKIDRVEIDGRPTAALNNLDASLNPTIKIELSSPYDIDKTTLAALLDGVTVSPLILSDVQTFGNQPNTLRLTLTLAPRNLAAGKHTISVRSGNSLGSSTQAITFNAGAVRVKEKRP
jgi:hypothetical protein